MSLAQVSSVLSGTFSDPGITRRKLFLYLGLLIPGSAVYVFYVFLLFKVTIEMLREQPYAIFSWIILGLLVLAILIAITLMHSLLLNLFRVSQIEFRPNKCVVTYASGVSIRLTGGSKVIEKSFLVDLQDTEHFGCMSKVFLNGYTPFVISKSMENAEAIFESLEK